MDQSFSDGEVQLDIFGLACKLDEGLQQEATMRKSRVPEAKAADCKGSPLFFCRLCKPSIWL